MKVSRRATWAGVVSLCCLLLPADGYAGDPRESVSGTLSAPWDGVCKSDHETLIALIDIGQRLRMSSRIDDAAMERVDAATTDILRVIVKKCGWPTEQAAGLEAAKGAFLTLQHTPDASWQKEMLETLRPLAETSKMSRKDFAYLSDRVAIRAGEPQTWGTQFHCEAGVAEFFPLKRPKDLDALRRDYGLGSFADYKMLAEGTCKGSGS